MRKTREILRLKLLLKRSHREIRKATGAGLGTISDTATRAAAAQLDWAAVEELDDEALEARLYVRGHRAATCQARPPSTSSSVGRAGRCGCCTRST